MKKFLSFLVIALTASALAFAAPTHSKSHGSGNAKSAGDKGCVNCYVKSNG